MLALTSFPLTITLMSDPASQPVPPRVMPIGRFGPKLATYAWLILTEGLGVFGEAAFPTLVFRLGPSLSRLVMRCCACAMYRPLGNCFIYSLKSCSLVLSLMASHINKSGSVSRAD